MIGHDRDHNIKMHSHNFHLFQLVSYFIQLSLVVLEFDIKSSSFRYHVFGFNSCFVYFVDLWKNFLFLHVAGQHLAFHCSHVLYYAQIFLFLLLVGHVLPGSQRRNIASDWRDIGSFGGTGSADYMSLFLSLQFANELSCLIEGMFFLGDFLSGWGKFNVFLF